MHLFNRAQLMTQEDIRYGLAIIEVWQGLLKNPAVRSFETDKPKAKIVVTGYIDRLHKTNAQLQGENQRVLISSPTRRGIHTSSHVLNHFSRREETPDCVGEIMSG